MDLHDTPYAVDSTQIIAPGSYHSSPTFEPWLKGERISNHNDSAPGWRQELAQDALRSVHLDQRFPDVSFLQSASLPWLPAASLTSGAMLSQMMELCPSRAPLATQEELYITLQHFSKRGGALPRDRFFYVQAGVVELISQAVEKRLMDSSQAGSLFVGVQHLSRAASQFPRYRALAHHARDVCLYGPPPK